VQRLGCLREWPLIAHVAVGHAAAERRAEESRIGASLERACGVDHERTASDGLGDGLVGSVELERHKLEGAASDAEAREPVARLVKALPRAATDLQR